MPFGTDAGGAAVIIAIVAFVKGRVKIAGSQVDVKKWLPEQDSNLRPID